MVLKKIIKKDSYIYFFLKRMKMKLIDIRFNYMDLEEKKKYIGKLYKKHIGKEIDWDAPKSYTEKIQCEKLYGSLEYKILLADKYRVRNWVESRIGKEYLIEILGVWKNVDEIDFSKLPNKFVLKTNCASGDAIVITNKGKLKNSEIAKYRKKLNYYLNCKYGIDTGEFQYSNMKPLIIAEKFIGFGEEDLPDYKFLCFEGVPYYCWVDVGRHHNHKRNVYDMNWELQNWNQERYGNTEFEIPKPANFEKMIEIATKLSNGFKHVRVDLYNVKGKIYFGEMTFTNGSGFEPIIPNEADLMLGAMWKL